MLVVVLHQPEGTIVKVLETSHSKEALPLQICKEGKKSIILF